MFDDLRAREISAFHDRTLGDPDWPHQAPSARLEGVWRWIEANHRCNCLLWAEEDQARRTDVADREIAANKRAIDRYNQRRNDAIEEMDQRILARLEGVTPAADAWLNSETAGSIIDRLSIVALKIHHMGIQAERRDVEADHRALARGRLERLQLQRTDLQYCLDTLLSAASQGRALFRVYRQFKMYNDPRMNPYLSGMHGGGGDA